jgi:hypothetical protein
MRPDPIVRLLYVFFMTLETVPIYLHLGYLLALRWVVRRMPAWLFAIHDYRSLRRCILRQILLAVVKQLEKDDFNDEPNSHH